jgi:UDP-N-acetyl-D-mannosaminuronic acid dehydrogenase
LLNIEELKKKIRKKAVKICVVGMGQVGLPTALVFADEKFHVTGYDINEKLIESLKLKISPFVEKGLPELLEQTIENKKFTPTSNLSDVIDSDIFIICVQTPLSKLGQPNLSYLENICSNLSKHNLTGKMIIIESSIPSGTFEKLVIPSLNIQNKIGDDVWAAFVPERLSPGQGLSEFRTTPRLVGSLDDDSASISKILYEQIIQSKIISSSVKVVEISKLVENTFRDVNIALSNEVAKICEIYDIDVQELFTICNSHPRVNLLQPGPGVGGPCLPKDPYLLLNPKGLQPITSTLIEHSRKINDSMPKHVVELLTKSLMLQNKKIDNSKILILGIAYKGNVSDHRLSPATEVVSQLQEANSDVLIFDPKVKDYLDGLKVDDLWNSLKTIDAIIVLADHDEFKKLDLHKIYRLMKKNPILLDTRRIFDKYQAEEIGFHYISIGYTTSLKHK